MISKFPLCFAFFRVFRGPLFRLSRTVLVNLSVAALCLCPVPFAGAAGYPQWWISNGVVNVNAPVTNDYAAANQGQVKWIATKAAEELTGHLPGGAGSTVQVAVSAFTSTNNYLPVNLGQLKNLATNFYARLIAEGYTNQVPWAGAAQTNDYAAVNVGQVKQLFSFNLTLDSNSNGIPDWKETDADGDGLPDWWEIKWFGSITNQNATGDPDGDGLNNAMEYALGTNPLLPDQVFTVASPAPGAKILW